VYALYHIIIIIIVIDGNYSDQKLIKEETNMHHRSNDLCSKKYNNMIKEEILVNTIKYVYYDIL